MGSISFVTYYITSPVHRQMTYFFWGNNFKPGISEVTPTLVLRYNEQKPKQLKKQ